MTLLTLAAAPLMSTQTGYRNGSTMTGLDVLVAEGFKPLLGKRVGLVTNHTGVDRNGRRSIDSMRAAGVQLVALFSPEHGFAGTEDRSGLGDATDAATSLKIFSLYGKTLRPTAEMLQGIDALVFDIADVGVRFYTYETTMAFCMEEAAKAGIAYYVLDRPNPVTGVRVEGPLLGEGNTSFAGYHPGTPARHGMTMGELAGMFNAERKIGANLTVIKMKDWQRTDWFDSTGLPWINPSPNMRSLKAAILYPGVCLVEFAKNISVGRGTDSPFEQMGADFIKGRELAAELNSRGIPGIRVYPTSFTPTESRFKDVKVEGVRFEIVDREAVDSVRLGIELACAIEKLYPGKVDWKESRKLIGSDDVVARIAAGDDAATIQKSWGADLERFRTIRQKYLLY
ncbi:MAG TPA: DUF1343 domain-containing protein [Fimbriimonadaceae bacterium]|nr:DUF1343 domain-containing protein [Fimbriimonadaceae bacterium]